jgi:hypothetical protein
MRTPGAASILEQDLVNANRALPDALHYYPPIYQMHIALVMVCVAAETLLTACVPSALNLVATIALLGFALLLSGCVGNGDRKRCEA